MSDEETDGKELFNQKEEMMQYASNERGDVWQRLNAKVFIETSNLLICVDANIIPSGRIARGFQEQLTVFMMIKINIL